MGGALLGGLFYCQGLVSCRLFLAVIPAVD